MSSLVTRDRVVATGTPQVTRTWTPVSHYWVLNTVEGALAGSGFKVVGERHELTCHDDQYFCRLDLTNGRANTGYSPSVGIRNSHNKKFSVGICWGAQITVCSNLIFSGEHVIQRKHVGLVKERIEDELAESIGRLQVRYAEQDKTFQEYKQQLLTKDQSHLLLMLLLERGIISGSQLDLVRKQLVGDSVNAGPRAIMESISTDNYPFNLGVKEGYVNSWEVIQAVSSVFRGRVSEGSQAEKTILLTEILNNGASHSSDRHSTRGRR